MFDPTADRTYDLPHSSHIKHCIAEAVVNEIYGYYVLKKRVEVWQSSRKYAKGNILKPNFM